MHIKLAIILTLTTFSVFSQITFEPGYFINNTGIKTECLIKNSDWKNNPTSFEYKGSENSTTIKANISDIKEFSINGFSKHIRVDIKIDRSSKLVGKLSDKRNPIWNYETLFLKVLVEGKANLYYYEDGNLERFFYSTENDTLIQQLIYKEYTTKGDKIGINNTYKQQLLNILKCDKINSSRFMKVRHLRKELVKLFIEYNNCHGSNITNLDTRKNRNRLDLRLSAGYSNYSMSMTSTSYWNSDVKFDKRSSYSFGVETEFVLPINKDKWGVIFEPTFQSYKSEGEGTWEKIKINFTSLEFPIGIRYYIFLNEDLKLFINSQWSSSICYNFNSQVEFERRDSENFWPISNFIFGAGINFRRFSTELRYYTDRELHIPGYSTDNRRLAFILRYQLF